MFYNFEKRWQEISQDKFNFFFFLISIKLNLETIGTLLIRLVSSIFVLEKFKRVLLVRTSESRNDQFLNATNDLGQVLIKYLSNNFIEERRVKLRN